MNSPIDSARRILRTGLETGLARASGTRTAGPVRLMGSQLAAVTSVTDSLLTVAPTYGTYQTASGAFVFIAGYSAVGGPDVLA